MSKTIKIIDLLNKIANGEEVPKKIKVYNRNDSIYEWTSITDTHIHYYFNINTHERLGQDWRLDGSILNEEVEIIEEQEEIDKLEIDENGFIHTNNGSWKGRKLDVAFAKTINKLAETIKNIKEKQ